MIRPRSIKRKLQIWVFLIFVLTGTAGWAGIWGLLYISQSTKSATGQNLDRAEQASLVDTALASARRYEREVLRAPDAATRVKWGRGLEGAVGEVGAALGKLGERLSDPAKVEALEALHAQAATALGAATKVLEAGRPLTDAAEYAVFDAKLGELEAQTRTVAAGAFEAVRGDSARVFDWIWILQVALFATVLVCQVFSAWAGWQLSRSLAAELRSLKDSAERISMGDLKNEVRVATQDVEIVAVGEALDRLRVSLGKAMDRLAKRAPAAQGQGSS